MHVDLGVVTPKRSLGLQWEIKKFLDQLLTPTARGGGGTLGVSRGDVPLEPLTYTRASSAKFATLY